MRIGIDFDNTIICYDEVFTQLAKAGLWLAPDWQGTKQQVREVIQATPEGDLLWQKLQGKAYGEYIQQAKIFSGFKEFVRACHAHPKHIEIFIVSHKTEFGHFDDKQISLRQASREWLRQQGLFNPGYLNESQVFFETTREEKIERIKALQCSHFIDDLPEVLEHALFPKNVKRYLFQPPAGDQSFENTRSQNDASLGLFSSWEGIQHAFFPN